MTERSLTACVLLALGAFLCFVYWPALGGPFLLDDFINLPATKLDQISLSSLWTVALGNDSGTFGRPIPVLSFALNFWLSGDETLGFKGVNLVIHALNSVLLYLFVSRLITTIVQLTDAKRSATDIRLIALFTAAIWALHPLQVSTVMYVVQRMTLLVTTFTLGALYWYLIARMALIGSRQSLRYFGYCALCTLAALLCKENGVLVLFFILALEFLLFQGTVPKEKNRQFYASLVVFTVFPIIAGVAYFIINLDLFMDVYDRREYSLWDRLRTQPMALIFYLKMILVPDVSQMSLYHDAFPIVRSYSAGPVLALLTLLSLACVAILVRRRLSVLSIGIALFLISHLLESTILPLELVFEHRNYFAVVGVALPLVWYAQTMTRSQLVGKSLLPLGVIGVFLLGGMTQGRAVEWGDELTMHSIAVENQPLSLRARTAYSISLTRAADYESALHHYRVGAELYPKDPYMPLGSLLTHCIAGTFNENDFASALSTLKTGYISKDIVAVLNDLIKNKLNGHCESLNTGQLLQLYDIASAGQLSWLSRKELSILFANHGLILEKEGQLGRSTEQLQRSFAMNNRNIGVLLQLTGQQLLIGEFSEARDSLMLLEQINQRSEGRYEKEYVTLKNALLKLNSDDMAVADEEH